MITEPEILSGVVTGVKKKNRWLTRQFWRLQPLYALLALGHQELFPTLLPQSTLRGVVYHIVQWKATSRGTAEPTFSLSVRTVESH